MEAETAKSSKELRRIKKEKKQRKTDQLLKRLEQHGLLQTEAAAKLADKTVPKNILQELSKDSKVRHYRCRTVQVYIVKYRYVHFVYIKTSTIEVPVSSGSEFASV